jgi:hypothetical protein
LVVAAEKPDVIRGLVRSLRVADSNDFGWPKSAPFLPGVHLKMFEFISFPVLPPFFWR